MSVKTNAPYGYCQCGCGKRTTISPNNDKTYGYVKGKPRRFYKGHGVGRPRTRFEHPCECGCGQMTFSRFIRGHAMNVPEIKARSMVGLQVISYTDDEWITKTLENTLEEDHDYETPCRVWQGFLDPKTGYATAKRDGKNSTRHRLIYQYTHGVKLPRTMVVDHKCNVRGCLNVDHLQAVTYAGNSQRSKLKTHMTPDSVRELRTLHEAGMSQADLSKRYGLSPTGVYSIVTRRRWDSVV